MENMIFGRMIMTKFKVLSTALTTDERNLISNAIGDTYDISLVTTAAPNTIKEVSLVLVRGGADIHPRRYNGNPDLCGMIDLRVDRWEKKYINMALQYGISLFGICRGAQATWVELGGRLREEVHPTHSSTFLVNNIHKVSGLWGECAVNSLHHQAVKEPEPVEGVNITMASADGVVEAFTYLDYIACVQWHPEWMPHQLWSTLLLACIDGWVDQVEDMSYSLWDIAKYRRRERGQYRTI